MQGHSYARFHVWATPPRVSFLPTWARGPRDMLGTCRDMLGPGKLSTPDVTLPKPELAQRSRLPHSRSCCESTCSTPAPSQTVPLWVIELAQPQCPQEYCQCFPACVDHKYFQFTQDINRHCCRKTPVQFYIWHLAQLEVYTTEQIFSPKMSL